MGDMAGYRQVSLYVEPEVYRLTKLLVVKTKRPIYQIVNDALRAEIDKCMTRVERKALESFLDKGELHAKTAPVRPAKRDKSRRVARGTDA